MQKNGSRDEKRKEQNYLKANPSFGSHPFTAKILTDHLCYVRHCSQYGNLWSKATRVTFMILWFSATVSSLHKQEYPCCVIRKSKWDHVSTTVWGDIWCPASYLSFSFLFTWALFSLSTFQALSLPWWLQAALPSYSLEVHDYESSMPVFLPQAVLQNLSILGLCHHWGLTRLTFSAYSWKRKANHKHILGFRVKGGSNPCSANQLGIGPLNAATYTPDTLNPTDVK